MEAFHPPKECDATGTGIGTLMPTIPTCTSRSNRRAIPPSRVKRSRPVAYGLAFTKATASSNVGTRTTLSTGPKISSL